MGHAAAVGRVLPPAAALASFFPRVAEAGPNENPQPFKKFIFFARHVERRTKQNIALGIYQVGSVCAAWSILLEELYMVGTWVGRPSRQTLTQQQDTGRTGTTHDAPQQKFASPPSPSPVCLDWPRRRRSRQRALFVSSAFISLFFSHPNPT